MTKLAEVFIIHEIEIVDLTDPKARARAAIQLWLSWIRGLPAELGWDKQTEGMKESDLSFLAYMEEVWSDGYGALRAGTEPRKIHLRSAFADIKRERQFEPASAMAIACMHLILNSPDSPFGEPAQQGIQDSLVSAGLSILRDVGTEAPSDQTPDRSGMN